MAAGPLVTMRGEGAPGDHHQESERGMTCAAGGEAGEVEGEAVSNEALW